LPFDSTLKDITNDIDTLDIHKDDIVIMNTSPESIHDIKIFDALQQEMPQFQFININDRSLTQPEYQRLLARSKVVLSLNRTDTDPYTILESMALGSIPILPDLPLYSEMFNNEWLYSNISLKPPYLNFIRNREEIIQKIWNSVENYLNYNLQNEVQEITNTYYNSKDLKQILCKLIN
jgi:glycosyltransferase involved in cell wall biosynthesis